MAAPATLSAFNILRGTDGVAIVGARVQCTLSINYATVAATGDAIDEIQQSTTTDGTGTYSFTIIGNDLLSPANTVYTIMEPHRSYQIAPQSTNGASQQTTAANVIVSTPTPLAVATSNITGNLTIAGTLGVTGLISANGGLTVAGTLAIPSGGFSMAGPLTLTAATSRIVPGATSMSLRNTANSADNLLVTDAGVVTVRAGLTVTAGGATITAGSLTMGTAVSKIVPGATSLSLRNNADNADNLLISNAGAVTVRAGLTVTASGITVTAGGQTISSGNLVLTTGNLTVTAGSINIGTAASQIIPGATSLSLRNNANNANNLIILDAGGATFRSSVSVPPSAGAALPTTNYGTLPVKLDDQSTASAANMTVTVPAGGIYRTLRLYFTGRSDQGGAQVVSMQFNADTAGNYDFQFTSVANVTLTNQAPNVAVTAFRLGVIPPTGAATGAVSACDATISNADSTTLRKVHRYGAGRWDADAAASANQEWGWGQWRNTTSAITSIKIFPTAGNLINARAILVGEP